jgi:hypothetical protein
MLVRRGVQKRTYGPVSRLLARSRDKRIRRIGLRANCHSRQQGFVAIFGVLRHTFEFCRELKLDASARFVKFSLSPCDVCQYDVQPLWAEYHESERNYEQQLRAKTHDSPRSAMVSCDDGCGVGRLLFLFHG